MSVNLEESYAPLSTRQIEEVESTLAIELPRDYRAFLLSNNGGRPIPDAFQMSGRWEMVDRFLGIHEGEHDNLLDYVNAYQGRLPPELLPIAHDAFGNLICLAVRGGEYGGVYFWDHEWEAGSGGPSNYDNVTCIAESFEAFLASMRALPDEMDGSS
ncbi:SMI1/KNR4 family protein [Archangium violaceum]|uniref:SMI1/KNR4 family protein n=1 Tax=Archangium violaceum TaxID=83451 RepID=UPI00069832AF|nr:SMI1/KNR4 family protein [Archangium violaceum]